jgi:phospholipid/cholesterol/gamma-HCH transport system ATP-binding protein
VIIAATPIAPSSVTEQSGDIPLPDEPLIEIKDLHFSYGEREVLKGINLSIPRGKVVAILGSSGCGKTTLMRLIGGQLLPASGFVKVAGEVVHQLDNKALYQLRRKMGMMFQAGGLFSDLSVYENIAFPMRTMYDEPFAGLDPISLGVIANIIRRLSDALGLTSIVVTYDIAESLKIVDYAYFIDNGIVVAEGPAAEMQHSDHPFVHQFVHGEEDGPVRFHYPARDLALDLGLAR